jgi:L-ascorbate metabolism protein UlaG (beta-lactamase superfamily)
MFCNGGAASKVPWAQVMKPGDIKTTGNITIEAVPAYNIVNERAKGQPFHPKGVGIGYIVRIGDKKFYIAGDTENTPEMKALKGIDIAFLPMNLPYTMTPAMVADAAKAFRPKILYPYHYGDTNTDEIVRLMKGTNTEVRIRKLK